jgi:S-adenosylmethionine:tRNA ribosyltransferase-isomerase
MLHVTAEERHDRVVRDLPGLLRAGDLMVANDTRVIPAQLQARRGKAAIGITLDRPSPNGDWHALARNSRRLQVGDELRFDGDAALRAVVVQNNTDGSIILRLNVAGEALGLALQAAGALALPPYVARPNGVTATDHENYQTIFAASPGAVAAPTAGLHFTPALLDRIAAHKVDQVTVTLHVGAGTFLPVRSDSLEGHRMHAERGEISAAAAAAINAARARGGRILAVGTTTLRLLESAVRSDGTVAPFSAETSIFIRPGMELKAADLLLTNFHLPRSTLFMLVCAFSGIERMKAAYNYAIGAEYRFFSYGDATLLEKA